MNKRYVRELVYKGLSPLSANGFRLKKNEEGFVRTITPGKQTIGVPLYDYNPQFEFSITACTRLDAVEDIFHLFSGSPPKYHSATYTMLTLLSFFSHTETAMFTVSTEEETWDALSQLMPILQEMVVPFLDEHQTIISLDRAMNYNGGFVDISHHPSRGMHGIILAHLAENSGFDNLVTKYQLEMNDFPSSEQEKFYKLVDYLKSKEKEKGTS